MVEQWHSIPVDTDTPESLLPHIIDHFPTTQRYNSFDNTARDTIHFK